MFVSPYDPYDTTIGNHLVKHGDGVKDVAFEVQELDVIVEVCLRRQMFHSNVKIKLHSLFFFLHCSVQRSKVLFLLETFGPNQMNSVPFDLQL